MTYEEVIKLIREKGGYTNARTDLRRMLADMEGTGVTTEIASLSQGELIARLTMANAEEKPAVKDDETAAEPAPAPVAEPAPVAVTTPPPAPAEQDDLPWDEPVAVTPPAPKPAPKPTAKPSDDGVKAALATLAAALAEPKPSAVDTKRIVAEAVAESVKAAKAEAHAEAERSASNFMKRSVVEFLKDGTVPEAEPADDTPPPKAVKGGVAVADKASGWTAKATPKAKEAVEKLTKFLSEFSYFHDGVSMRLVNTFARAKTDKDKKSVIASYCEVSQMEDLPNLKEKMKSPEFKEVCKCFADLAVKDCLNTRFAVFYGAPGGGKTYAAINAGNAINGGDCEVVPCSPSMDAADLLYAYRLDYKTGKRGYVPTALLTAMTSGRAVVLDEVNLLPMEARMFLQNILDNKSKVSVMGVEIPIKDGFFVIGTMNLETGLGVTPLPLPLVDRASVVREFRTSVEQCAVGAGLA